VAEPKPATAAAKHVFCASERRAATNLQRPVTYINDRIDKRWTTYIVTPNFPSYPSGHSTQSGAAARVLTAMFGTKRFTDTTHADHGLPALAPRRFDSFAEACVRGSHL
jgi:membrane-associated phospholipid phosphatase